MDLLSVALALFFLVVSYILFERYIQGDNYERITQDGAPMMGNPEAVGGVMAEPGNPETNGGAGGMVADVMTSASNGSVGESPLVREVVYTQDYYPWWRSTRWWNYDGWLYQRPYFNHWRRPQFANYWSEGRPLIVDGKRYYKRDFQ